MIHQIQCVIGGDTVCHGGQILWQAASGAGQVVSPARKQREVGVEAPSSFPLLIQSRIP